MFNCKLEVYHKRLARHKESDRYYKVLHGLRLKVRHLWDYTIDTFRGVYDISVM
jgi:hypothetical protein